MGKRLLRMQVRIGIGIRMRVEGLLLGGMRSLALEMLLLLRLGLLLLLLLLLRMLEREGIAWGGRGGLHARMRLEGGIGGGIIGIHYYYNSILLLLRSSGREKEGNRFVALKLDVGCSLFFSEASGRLERATQRGSERANERTGNESN